MKVIIAGTRTFNDYWLLKERCDLYFSNNLPEEIISGNAKGADKLGEKYAKENCIPLKIFFADWNKYGKQAGYLRNKQMAEYATHLIAFWDGKSVGTKNMIEQAKKMSLNIKVILSIETESTELS